MSQMTYFGFDVAPMSIGAEVTGLEIGDTIDARTRADLYKVWLEYGLLLIRNIDDTLKHVGSSFADVLKVTVFLTSIGDRAKVDAVRRAVFGLTRPAATLVEIAALVVPGAKIEIEVTAILRG